MPMLGCHSAIGLTTSGWPVSLTASMLHSQTDQTAASEDCAPASSQFPEIPNVRSAPYGLPTCAVSLCIEE